MGIMDRLVGSHVTDQLAAWAKDNAVPADYPADDLAKLKEVATEAAEKLPALAKELAAVLPKALPKAADASAELKTLAQRVSDHLLQLLPGHLRKELAAARAGSDVEWSDVRTEYGDLRKAVKATPYWKDSVPDTLAAFAVKHGVTPGELSAFSSRLDQVRALLPLVEMVGTDLTDRLHKLDDVLAKGLANAAAPASP